MQNLKNLFLSPKGHLMIFVSNVFLPEYCVCCIYIVDVPD